MAEEQPPHLHQNVLIPLTDRRGVRDIVGVIAECVTNCWRSLQQRLQTAVGFLRTEAEHVRRDPERLREPAATIRGGGFVGIVDDVVSKFDTLLAEGCFVPHIARGRPDPTGLPISLAAVYRFNEAF